MIVVDRHPGLRRGDGAFFCFRLNFPQSAMRLRANDTRMIDRR
jgi:hypothetical protein